MGNTGPGVDGVVDKKRHVKVLGYTDADLSSRFASSDGKSEQLMDEATVRKLMAAEKNRVLGTSGGRQKSEPQRSSGRDAKDAKDAKDQKHKLSQSKRSRKRSSSSRSRSRRKRRRSSSSSRRSSSSSSQSRARRKKQSEKRKQSVDRGEKGQKDKKDKEEKGKEEDKAGNAPSLHGSRIVLFDTLVSALHMSGQERQKQREGATN